MLLSPEDVLFTLSRSPPGIHVDLLHDIFPSATQLDLMLDDRCPDAIDSSIAVLDPLIPPFTLWSHSKTARSKQEADRRGFTTYARIVDALLQVFIEDRQLAKRALWALRHFLALSVYAQDLLHVPSPSSALSFSSKHDSNNYSPLFDHDVVTMSALRDIVSRVKQVSVYLLGSAVDQDDDGSWRKMVLGKLLKDAPASESGMSQVQLFLWDVVVYAKEQDKLRDTRVLKIILDSVFLDGVDVGEADLWIQLARKLEKTGMEPFFSF
jgi:E3 ubiquitin-protein ligase listerin